VASITKPMSVTGWEYFDQVVARQAPEELEVFLVAVRANGWIVKATDQLENEIAYFFPRKGRFYYDPSRMTRLDMMHENVHLKQFKRFGRWQSDAPARYAGEIEAYALEVELGRQHNFAPRYMEYLERQLTHYQGLLSPDSISGGLRPFVMPDPFFKKP
jgi:hypothetical protein